MMHDDVSSAEDPLGQIADEFVEVFRKGKNPSVASVYRALAEAPVEA